MKKGNIVFFKNSPVITSFAAVCGSKEKAGVLGSCADTTFDVCMCGESVRVKY